ncbi:hypothetical protein HBB16_13485 [Pseudonocardia sp. MCCB 268]|nr:hypothetical protein [Pseudonocardia cytotoxica]
MDLTSPSCGHRRRDDGAGRALVSPRAPFAAGGGAASTLYPGTTGRFPSFRACLGSARSRCKRSRRSRARRPHGTACSTARARDRRTPILPRRPHADRAEGRACRRDLRPLTAPCTTASP